MRPHHLRLALGFASLALFAWLAIVLWRPNGEPIPALIADSVPPPSSSASIELAALNGDLPERAVVSESESRPDTLLESRRILIRGSIVGPVPDLWRVQVGIFASCRIPNEDGRGSRRASIDVHVDPAGRFEADVTTLVRTCPLERDLLVVAKHPLSKPASINFQTKLATERSSDSEAESGALVTEVTLNLELGALIQGRVSAQTADPRAELALEMRKLESFVEPVRNGSRTYASQTQKWALDEGLPAWTYSMDGRVRRLSVDGEFEMPVEPGARYALVAAAAGLRPQTAIVDVLVEGVYRVDLTILPGEEIAGTLQLGPEMAPAGTQLIASLEGGDSEVQALRTDAGEMTWIDGAFEWSRALASTDARGSFAFRGLAPQRYALSAVGEGAPRQFVRGTNVGVFAAPEAGLHLGPCLTRVELDLGTARGGPLSFWLKPSDNSRLGPFETNSSGLATLHLRPQTTYEVSVLMDGVVGRVRTQSAGETSSWRRPR